MLGLAAAGQAASRGRMQMLAFLCRSGHQDIGTLLGLPVGFLYRLSEAVGEIMNDERDQFQRAFAGETD